MEKKLFRIAEHTIEVVLESPWTFKKLTPEQETLVSRLATGEDIGVESVPADRQEQLAVNDAIMGKTPMTREIWDAMDAGEKDAFRHSLDFLQYAPFEVADGTPLFTLTVHADPFDDSSRSAWKQVVAVDNVLPYYYGYEHDGNTIYEYFPVPDVKAGVFVQNDDATKGDYYPCKGVGARATLMQVNTSLMIQFTFTSAFRNTVLLHASVTRHNGMANLFFGVSGTGKSTHSRLWHQYVPGCDLMNDDNPVIRIIDGKAIVFGTPWSGKTLCYRNVQAPIRALVRLEQYPENKMDRLHSLQAYASVLAACSSIRWKHSVMDALIPTVEKLAMTVPCFRLQCRPDQEAVELCKQTIEQ
ncbi:MAG: hypothetical protein K6E61_04785 [Bacteroidales bacterium]|nr:hypothetical protein [Bacteroidales bacterium]